MCSYNIRRRMGYLVAPNGCCRDALHPATLSSTMGVSLCPLANLFGHVLRKSLASASVGPGLFSGLRVPLQVVTGPLDLWRHSTYSFDSTCSGPSHSPLGHG